MGAPHEEILSLIKTLSNNSCNCPFNSLNSADTIRQAALEIGPVPDKTTIENSVSISGGNPSKSSRKISKNIPIILYVLYEAKNI